MVVSQSPLVELKGAGIQRSGAWLVRGVDLTVSPKEIVTLIGPNGSGKSTSAKMALGILKPSEGTAARRSGLKIGYVPQKLMIDWTLPLSVERFMRLTAKPGQRQVDEALDCTGVAHLRASEVRHLSGGQMQRVMLARAIAMQPDLLVLDEPVQGVDYSGEIAIYDLIARIRSDLGCGILMISHDLHVVMAATDRVVCLNGHVCCQGTPRDVSESEAFKTLFGARASGALAVYEHHHDHVHLPDGRVQHSDGSIHQNCCDHVHGPQDHAHEHHGKGHEAHDHSHDHSHSHVAGDHHAR
ncbi:metal ABC transporter ATP-binding protein [Roseibium sediminis]|uniref:ATP-binding cassette domain-containing protein n=1 Tax=Roseibium sediminis TaxID=1775174 RepID=UPI00123DCDFD|nr:metal ABC transporter ATP-binding protein [Roseibium sediminis]